ncbi:hypothetical protein AM1_2909 [Acaryochloris marina MBIC11017]|uniref:Uncharacterized protein n=1 Tax=Acaryochloris marina (strain MBIC 11017) TaxID=329726 RepID=B0CBC3_ACAM1|nr:hypothetical protein AM1_2909 [Acaryochloris marina MBIC11017]
MTAIHTIQQSNVKPLDEKKVRFNLGSLVSSCTYGEIALSPSRQHLSCKQSRDQA